MHHKRKRPWHQRGKCHCKYWKDDRYPKAKRLPASELRRADSALDDEGEGWENIRREVEATP